jgi:hypothetical protein
MVALLIRSNASRHASAGGHLSIRSPNTDVAARTVKSTSSSDCSGQLDQTIRMSPCITGNDSDVPISFVRGHYAIPHIERIYLQHVRIQLKMKLSTLTSHEEVMSSQKCVIHKMHTMQLAIELQNFLASFGHFEKDQILVFSLFKIAHRGASHV